MSETDALTLLTHAIDYTYEISQKRARTREDHEDFNITLRLLGLLREGWATGDLFNLACGYAVGSSHGKYLRRRAERAEFERLELLRCIPDYDWSREPRIPDRDPTDGRRHYGNQFRKRSRLRNLVAQAIAASESNSTGGADADDAPAGLGFGDRPTAYDRHSTPSRARAAGFTEGPAADRRGAPKKRISSPAQQAFMERTRAMASYCGA